MIFNQLAALLATDRNDAHWGSWSLDSFDDKHATFSSNDLTLTVPVQDLKTQLQVLADVGHVAGQLFGVLERREQDLAEADRQRAREARAQQYSSGDPSVFGLIDAGDYWAVPGETAAIRVSPRAPKVTHYQAKDAVILDVTVNDVLIGAVVGDVDGQWRVEPNRQYRPYRSTADLVGTARYTELGESPWQAGTPSADTALEGIRSLVARAPEVTPWITAVDALLADAAVVEAERAAEASQWRRLSKPSGRIPTKALKKWMTDTSHIEYDSTGFATGGSKVTCHIVSGRTRPRHLDSQRPRQKAVGVAEVLYVARLERGSVRRHLDGAIGFQFYDSELVKLREALPDCVVRMPEDGSAIFVSTNDPAHVQELEAAMVEWVLLGR
jgi:hypothetical protein